MPPNLLQAQARSFDALAVVLVGLQLHSRQDSRRAAGPGEVDLTRVFFALQNRFKLRANFLFQKLFHPITAFGKFLGRWRISVRKFLHEPDGANGETARETFVTAVADDEFR